MKIYFSVLLCALVSAVDVDEQFRKHNIVPQLISVAPKDVLEVVYPRDAKVSLGEELTPTAVKDEPRVTWTAEPEGKYTLIMSDPDAASIKGFLHWLVVNITGSDLHTGTVLADYIGSGPPHGTGLHRYIFTVFKQPGPLNFTEQYSPNNSAVGRGGFTEQKFSEKYNLGAPVFGNFYRAQYDDYVPILHSQLFKKPTTPTPAVVSVPEYIESSTSPRTLDPLTDSPIPSHHDIKAAYISDDLVVHSKVLHEADATPNPVQSDATSDSSQAASTDGPIFIHPLLDQTAVTTEERLDATDPIPHDGLIKATFIGNDTIVHTKVDSAEHLSGANQSADLTGESSDESSLTTDTPVPHDHVIIAAFKLNDSVVHTKVLNEEEILHHMTEVYDTTEPTVPHNGVVKAAYVSDDLVVHSQSHTEEDLKIKQEDVKDSVVEASKVEPTKDAQESTKVEEALSEGHSTTGQSVINLKDGTVEYTTIVSVSDSESASASTPVSSVAADQSMSTHGSTSQSTEQSVTPVVTVHDEKSVGASATTGPQGQESEVISSSTAPSVHNEKLTHDSNISHVASNTEEAQTIDGSSTTAPSTHDGKPVESSSPTVATPSSAVSSKSSKALDIVTGTPPTYDIQTTISVSTSGEEKVEPKQDAVSYAGEVYEV